MLYPPSSHTRHSKRSLSLLAAFVLATTFSATKTASSTSTWFASAQNVVGGKFATRAKLVDGSTKKKKRKIFGGGKEAAASSDGEFSRKFWTRWTSSAANNNLSWSSSPSWELVLVESKMIFLSLITSVIFIVLSWIWYSFSVGGSGRKSIADEEEEDGGE
jgi:hypothetical protein